MDTNYDDIGKLEKQLAEIKKSQAGSDYKVTELQKENARLLEEKADLELKFSGKDQEEQIKYKQRNEFLDRKEKALSIALGKGISPELAFSLLGLNADLTDEDRLDLFKESQDQARFEERDKFAKSHGVKPRVSLGNSSLNYDQILKMSDSEIQKIPDSVLKNAMQAKKGEGKKTLRQKLVGGFKL